ncbi:hypothetical protein CDD82_3076 [Ophiocordyceps australis]|uniref:Uncharacterized protein n=1 Tax=Ophiocordyceps australis TaxID=1399860 RepID=A0A2C5ZES6_9HYPO|nr:hypothetical protein CDD82_3076 [Ophiocordyceps australis]
MPENEMSIPDSLVLPFATDVTGRLAVVAQGQSLDKLFCPALAAALWLVNQHLKNYERADSGLGKRLMKLLSNLEKICKPRTRQSIPHQKASLAHEYPGLSLLLQDERQNAVDGIRKLASSGRKRQQGLLRILEAFIKPLACADEIPTFKTENEAGASDDFSGSIRILYKVLARYIFCNNGSEKKQIAGRLRLALERGAKYNSPAFDLMFIAHPHQELQDISPMAPNPD